ncbi:hypothetical protein SAMN02745866_03844 [Alteromonadaceae bacterium Bs31]|nr:hypothetical protein SAMN02745866_03844 [Alteromonadaceae bacterium Bs31]
MIKLVLEKQLHEPNAKNLIFTSSGDWSNVADWLGEARNWDLWLCYYGDTSHKNALDADYYHEHKAGKFPNVFYAYQQWPEIFNRYDAIFVLDDDIIISTSDLNRLFNIRIEYDLWLLQPTFSPRGKISHRLTKTRGFRKLTFTNFVEVCTVLFKQSKFVEFMSVYDPKLVGWGVDFWLTDYFYGKEDKIAVTHEISCINPYDHTKGGNREIDTLQAQDNREAIWNEIKREKGIAEHPTREFKTLWQALSLTTLSRGLFLELERKYFRYRNKFIAPSK